MNINYIQKTFRVIISLVLLNTLYACESNYATGTSNTTTEMPAEIQKLTLASGGTLSAYVSVDGGARIEMTIDPAGAGSASASIPSLSLASHTVTITYEYTDINGTVILATATSTVDLTSGSGSLSFAATDYDFASHDSDGDGISNAAEIAAGTDPTDGACVLGSSIIGSCTLG